MADPERNNWFLRMNFQPTKPSGLSFRSIKVGMQPCACFQLPMIIVYVASMVFDKFNDFLTG